MVDARKIAIFGAGGFAREVAWLLSSDVSHQAYDLVGYIEDDAQPGRMVNGMPVLSWQTFPACAADTLLAVAVGNPQSRGKIVARCAAAGFSFATLVHPSVALSEFVELGAGAILCSGSVLTVNIKLERHVHINLNCTIGHDVHIGEFTTLSPGVHVSGHVHIGKYVFIGTGAVIVDGTAQKPLVIADGTVIGAGACVTRNTEPDSLYVGVPAEFKKSRG
ncbi:MAG: acetyltransferase [Burkholderiales bacterium]